MNILNYIFLDYILQFKLFFYNLTNREIVQVGAFRSKGRIPILSWIHPKNEATITRAAQPLVGIGGSRSTEDEHLIKEIIRATPSVPTTHYHLSRFH
jgi:hypothetical protein